MSALSLLKKICCSATTANALQICVQYVYSYCGIVSTKMQSAFEHANGGGAGMKCAYDSRFKWLLMYACKQMLDCEYVIMLKFYVATMQFAPISRLN